MAILALHRQLNSSWGSDRYASYYAHLNIEADQIRSIELPVCIVFFPDFHVGNERLVGSGLDLKRVCREIFLVVNKTAKRVSRERELLLDDDDFAARMMRRTLSSLKGRGEGMDTLARIYSFAYGDSSESAGGTVVSGLLEYSSAVALHKIHAANVFGKPDAFNIENPSDITDGRRVKNTERPARLLLGTPLDKWCTLSRWSGKYHAPKDVGEAVKLLGDITDVPLFKLFDVFRPFSVVNSELRKLRTRLSDTTHRADLVQSKCYTLLFEGSGVLNVFEDHKQRLKERVEEAEELGSEPDDYIKNQLDDANAVSAALDQHLEAIKKKRAASLFNIDNEKFFASCSEGDATKLLSVAKTIFSTVATQAFQIGYAMAVSTLSEIMLEDDAAPSYQKRMGVMAFLSELLVSGLNQYVMPSNDTIHKTLSGLIKERRSHIFDPDMPGLRRLLRLSGVVELNERQWPFFRYAILEMVHSRYGRVAVRRRLEDDEMMGQLYSSKLPKVAQLIVNRRREYMDSAVRRALEASDFKQDLEKRRAHLEGKGKRDTEIDNEIRQKQKDKETEIKDLCAECVKASLGKQEDDEAIVRECLLTDNTGG
jgi:hypothetical protein